MNVRNVLPRDAIESVDDPTFGPDHFGADGDEVLVVDADPPRAYPVRILCYHEIVNDVVAGEPVAVTWCPICWSGVVYDASVEGRRLTFGVSGKLADDALVMYDSQTGSEWKQTSGEAIAGEFEGHRLRVLSGPITTYGEFRAEHPEGVVLQPVRSPAEYDVSPYEEYAQGEAFGEYGMRGTGPRREWDRTDLAPKSAVLGVEVAGEAKGYPLERVRAAGGVVTDAVGGRDLVVLADVGELHAFADPGYDFRASEDGVRGDGTLWHHSGRSEDGHELERVPARRLFAFAWQDVHGPDVFYEA